MSVLVNEKTRVLIQGLTGQSARKHALNMRQNGTKIVAGVAPTKGGGFVEEWPIYDTVQQVLDHHDIDLSLIYAPPRYAAQAIIESIEAGIPIIVCVTEGIPIRDMLVVHNRLAASRSVLIGPCSPGITAPGKTKIGFLPDIACSPGNVGVIGKSGTLTYEACYQLTKSGIGQSTVIGIGGEPIRGLSFTDALALFENDDETELVVLIGEIGGREEEAAAVYLKNHVSKPVIAYICGRTAPENVAMGHAGAMISNQQGGYLDKVAALQANGAYVAESIPEIAALINKIRQESLP